MEDSVSKNILIKIITVSSMIEKKINNSTDYGRNFHRKSSLILYFSESINNFKFHRRPKWFSLVFCGRIIHPIKNHGCSDESRRQKDIRSIEIQRRYMRLRETLDSFVFSFQAADTTVRISYMSGYFSSPYLRDDDRCRTFSFSFTLTAYIPHDRAARSLSASFLPSFFHHSARSNRWSNPDFLLIAARGTRACKALSRRSNVRYPGECFLRRFHGNEKTQKAHRNYFAVVDRRSARPHNNFSTSLYHSA